MADNRESNLRQLVVFKVADEEFGADISNVREIIRLPRVTGVPTTPSTILGVTNLRGDMIPILSLRRLFLGAEATTGSYTRVLVVDADGRDVGLVVDSVTEVLRLGGDAIAEPPRSIGAAAVHYIEGIARVDDHLVLLVDMSHLVDSVIEDDYQIAQDRAA